MRKKAILLIRDGWGHRDSCEDNAICRAQTPNTDRIMDEYPNVLIDAAGLAVGLPDGFQGNSEVGHMSIGSGRIIRQSMVRIDESIADGSFFEIPEFLQAIDNCRKNDSSLHIIGLLQSEGVHAHENHLHALLELCQKQGFNDLLIHVITDGRDAPVTDSVKHLKLLFEKIGETGVGEIATISGRYYAMDRNKNWARTKIAYDCVVEGACEEKFDDALKMVSMCHEGEETDEFIKPRKKTGYDGVRDGDSFIFYNFRTDRTRQLTQAMVEDDFKGFQRNLKDICFVAMTQFYEPMNAKVAFPDIQLTNLFGKVVGDAGLKQLRISETEKYAHVTFFFNGQLEEPYPCEDRELIQSPDVATYDLKPEMSVYEITEKLVDKINEDKYDLIVVNLVNCDMVGHTGLTPAIEKAVASVDDCVGKIVDAGLEKDYALLVFADHGNAEDQTPQWRTSHTQNPVPLILVSNDPDLKNCALREGGGLSDIAPTALDILGIGKPAEMTGESLIKRCLKE